MNNRFSKPTAAPRPTGRAVASNAGSAGGNSLASKTNTPIGRPVASGARPTAPVGKPVTTASRPVATASRPNSAATRPTDALVDKPVAGRPTVATARPTAPSGRPVASTARPAGLRPVAGKPVAETKAPATDTNKRDFSSLKQSLLSKVDKINSYSSSKFAKNDTDEAVDTLVNKDVTSVQPVNNFNDVAVASAKAETPVAESVDVATEEQNNVVEPVVEPVKEPAVVAVATQPEPRAEEVTQEASVQNSREPEEQKLPSNQEHREPTGREFYGSAVNNQSVNERFERQREVQGNTNQNFAQHTQQPESVRGVAGVENSAQSQNYEKSFAEIRNLKATISGLQSTLLGGRASEGRASSANHGSSLQGQMVGYETAGSQPVAYQTAEHQASGYQSVGYASGNSYESGDSYGVLVSGENRNLNGNLNTYYDNYNNGDIIMHNATDRELEREIYDLKTSLAVLMEKVAAENNRPATVMVDNGGRDNLRLIHELRTSIAVLNERISNKNGQQRYIVYR